MTNSRALTAALMVATIVGVYAQTISPVPTLTDSVATATPSYITVTYLEDCASEQPVTVTEGVTITSCPLCTGTSTGVPTHTTVYITTFQTFCPTGLAPVEYTITETCTGETPSWPMTTAANHVPPGFVATVTECRVCGEEPITATLTIPCEKCKGAPAGPTLAPNVPPSGGPPSSLGQGSPGQSNTNAHDQGAPAPGFANTPAAPGGQHTVSYPYPSGLNTTVKACAGGPCRPAATGEGYAVSSSAGFGGPGATHGLEPAASSGVKSEGPPSMAIAWHGVMLLLVAAGGTLVLIQ